MIQYQQPETEQDFLQMVKDLEVNNKEKEGLTATYDAATQRLEELRTEMAQVMKVHETTGNKIYHLQWEIFNMEDAVEAYRYNTRGG